MASRRRRFSMPRDRSTPPVHGQGGVRTLLSMRSLAGRIFLVEIVLVLLLVVAAVTAMVLQARSTTTDEARMVTRGVAESFAHSPGLVQALDGPNPSAVLQPLAEQVREATGVDSVVVFTTSYVQLTSPYPDYVGRPYDAPPYVRQKVVPELLAGHTVTFELNEPNTGFRSIATAAPVFAPDGTPKGVVAVNITVAKVNAVVTANLPVVLGGAAAGLALAAAGTALAARRLLRQTRGLGPEELARMYEHHDAVLHAVREGVLITGADGRLTLANDEARRLLDLPPDAEGRPLAELNLDPATERLLTSDEPVTDAVHPAGARLLAISKRPTAPYGGQPGSVVTLRDSTELHRLAGHVELAGRRRQLLYEAGLGIGRTLDMTRTCEELAEVLAGRFADVVSVDLLDAVADGDTPGGPGGRLRRIAVRGTPAGDGLPVGEVVDCPPSSPQARSLESGRAVLESALGSEGAGHPPAHGPSPARQFTGSGAHSMITVPLRAHGELLGLVEFWRIDSSAPFEPDDLSLADEIAARAAVSIDNARRYSREHGLATALQRSLLPRSLPQQAAVDVAFRYLPAHASVGGDWFDVIPLPGFRTALVVGDVVGHGIHAAVAMGRLRTAVHNFAALDLPPEEVLGRLDELVERLDAEDGDPPEPADPERAEATSRRVSASHPERAEAGGRISAPITGTTCLYAVYDPVTGTCTMARAGHLGPALVDPAGGVEFPEVPVSPPLGVGGGPFETVELRPAEGSQLVLFTDGLVETRGHDLDLGLERLRAALAGNGRRDPDATCRAVTEALLAEHPGDDVALLVARTRRLAADHIAEWQVPADPAAVAPVRSACGRRLAEWGLDEIGFTTELILSELITNAIRYGSPPVAVRLLYEDGRLVCEVSDGSSTSPHLRWADTSDEGGRGIFLVAQLAHRWGTRYTATGKVIWSEQPAAPEPPAAR